MKKIFFALLLVSVVGINFTVLAQGESEGVGDGGSVTCYATYDSGGVTTITKCNGCVEQQNITNQRDPGTCKPH